MEEMSVRDFQSRVYAFYHGNWREFPWRETHDPYHILVSEMMLQQTQVERVLPRYLSFTGLFPDFFALASATPGDVVRQWQGLGYNRRAIYLHRIAERVVDCHGGFLPEDEAALRDLPGIGKATAAAIMAFAFGRPSVLVETNIRRVFIHCFFPGEIGVNDARILPRVEKTLDRENPREWYYALMDLGVFLKKKYGNANRRSAHYQRQSVFQGSDRQIRGRILDLLREYPVMEVDQLLLQLDADPDRARALLMQLEDEGFLEIHGRTAMLA